MNNVTVKKKFSALAIVSMIGAILFAIAAGCMIFLPVMSSGNANTFDTSVIGKTGDAFMKTWSSLYAPNLNLMAGAEKDFFIFYLIEVITATVAFFGMIACGLMVVLGKALNFKHGGRVLALLFAIFGFAISGFFLAWTIIFAAKGNEYNNTAISVNVGIGPILMCSFSFVALIFCFLGLSDKKAFIKSVGAPALATPYSGDPVQNVINPVINVTPNPYGQPVPQPEPQPFAPQPVQNSYEQPAPNPYMQQNAPAPNPYMQQNAPAPNPYMQQNAPAPNPYMQQNAPAPQPFAPEPVPQPDVPQAPAPLNAVKAVEEEAPTIAQIGAIEGVCGQFANAVINLKPNEKVLIGRDPSSCNIVISSEKKDISRTHCSVKYDPYTDSFKVIDMSSNGTFVGGQKLVRDQETQFPAGTVLSLGSGENQFRLKKV